MMCVSPTAQVNASGCRINSRRGSSVREPYQVARIRGALHMSVNGHSPRVVAHIALLKRPSIPYVDREV